MPTGKQIRAARILAEWDAKDLADRVGMSRVAIQNIERGAAKPKDSTLEKIVRAFSEIGIEFIENEGIKRRPENVEIFEGPERFDDFYDFLYEHLRQNGGDVCLRVTDEHLLAKYRRDPNLHRNRMQSLVDSGRVTFRILAQKSEFKSNYAKYRKQSMQQDVTPSGFYAFGHCLALMSFLDKHSPYIIVIQSAVMTEAYRQEFNAAWEREKDPILSVIGK